MALKGTTKIELTNVKTGEVEVIEKHNLVTNAVADLLAMNPLCYKEGVSSGSFMGREDILPLYEKEFGGILLYQNAIPENPDSYFAQSDNPIVGYANNVVNGTTEKMRGSRNQTESGMLDDGNGYRFVYDFETSQGNGTIAAIGLTSRYGGEWGYGTGVREDDYTNTNVAKSALEITIRSNESADYKKAICGIRMLDAQKDIAYSVRISADKTLEAAKINFPINSIGLTFKDRFQVLENTTISTSVFGKYAGECYIAFCHDGGYIWGFQHANNATGNRSGSATINWIKIDPEDWSFEEGTWTIPAQIKGLGYQYTSGTNTYYTDNDMIVHDGYLYCFSYDGYKIFRINVNNPTDLKEYQYEDKSVMYRSVYSANTGKSMFDVIGNVVGFYGGYIIGDKVHKTYIYSSGSSGMQYPYSYQGQKLDIGPYKIKINQYRGANFNQRIYVGVVNPYLATINNLPAPVQKTADKTMKITYILREES